MISCFFIKKDAKSNQALVKSKVINEKSLSKEKSICDVEKIKIREIKIKSDVIDAKANEIKNKSTLLRKVDNCGLKKYQVYGKSNENRKLSNDNKVKHF